MIKSVTKSPEELAKRYGKDVLKKLRSTTTELSTLVKPSEKKILEGNIELYNNALRILEKNS